MSRPHPLRLGRLELRRFTRSRLTRAALAAVVLLPLLYAGLYLWSFWDPQNRLDRIPVALVVADRPVTVDGRPLHAGADLAGELRDREVFAWHQVDAAQADRGVRDGTYYLSLTIPADFSADLASPDRAGKPVPAELGVRVDTGRSYIMRSISDAVFAEVRDSAARGAVRGYLDKIFLSFGDLHDATAEAAGGADRLSDGAAAAGEGAATLDDGLGTARQGSRRLAAGAHTAHQGTASLAGGLATARQGTETLRRGLATLDKGAADLAAGNAKAYQEVHAHSGKINDAADRYVPVLNRDGERIRQGALAVARGADQVADGLGTLPAQVTADAGRTRRDLGAVESWLDAHPDADPELRTLVRRAAGSGQDLATGAGRLQDRLQARDAALDELRRSARTVADSARELAAAAPKLGDRLEAARDAYNRLDDGLARLAKGSAELSEGTGTASAAAGRLGTGLTTLAGGADRLDSGLAALDQGAGRLDSGLGTLQDGAGRLDRGLVKLADGSKELADRLDDGAGRIPDYSAAGRDARTGMMSDPVRLHDEVDNEVPNYGTGFAPFFVPLALWVGAMVVYMVLRPLNPRLLAGSAPAWRIALAGWLPGVALGLLQVAVLLGVTGLGLGLHAVNWAGMAGLLALTVTAFLAIVQAVNALAGPPGRVLVLALLMLQLTSAGGTYPIETSPGFFQAISPWLPMSWVVRALRRLISGGDAAVVWQACGVLTAFTALGLALTVLAARRGRTWTMRRLHPELSL
ncbi:membrane protein [Sphaerisporangium rufum]|uniref:Membrane protein n=1 Tax=Sphaerisporangium rufum TaxID=1381558 RepID=A0A919UYN2_9ACTN|nr:YhgE/Pip domain-containing protein [Sphaerisporangium rufum]GII75297.1 membrane protein [Sphaerisporangium rufum]